MARQRLTVFVMVLGFVCTFPAGVGLDAGVADTPPSDDHYLVADRHGGVVVLEFLDGRMVARTGAELCAAALTNSAYEDSCNLWESLRPAGNYDQQNNSIHRFCLAADRVQYFQPGTTAHSVGYAFDTLH